MPIDEEVSSCDPIAVGDHCDCWELGEPCCLCDEDDDNEGCYPEANEDEFDVEDEDDYDDEFDDDDYDDDDEDEDEDNEDLDDDEDY